MIEFKNISKTYYANTSAEIKALNGVNLKINDGEFVAIIGASGSGKSTLLNIIGCLDTADKGEYLLDNKSISEFSHNKLAEIRNRHIGFVLQEFGLMLDRTVYQNLSYPLVFNSKVKSSKFKELSEKALELVGISKRINSKCNELSGGQKQRVAIARALINNPKILLADEPTGALDTKTSDEIMKLFEDLNEKGITILIVTHDQNIAKRCNRVIEISDGMIVNE